MINIKEIFENIFEENGKIYTKSLVKGQRVYGEKINNDYREWIPDRSKLGASIKKGMKQMPIKIDSVVLYLGASTGTTVSHVSDIVKDGTVYAVEFAERVFRNLLELAETRNNIIPIIADARKTELYKSVELVDVVFVDIADPQQTEIAIQNANIFLKKNGFLMISVKSQSIDVTKKPEQIFSQEKEKVRKANYEVIEVLSLEPYEKDHAMIIAKKS